MKPEGDVIEFATPMDFCHFALGEATDLVYKELTHLNTTTHYILPKSLMTLVLSVECSDLLRAMDIARVFDLKLELRKSFEKDEWAIEAHEFDGLALKTTRAINFWCAGA